MVFLNLFLLLVQSNQSVASCSCICGLNATYEFSAKLTQDQFIGMIEVIGKDSITYHDSYKYYYTKVRVLRQYANAKYSDTLFLERSNGMDCKRSINWNKVGETFIIHARNPYVLNSSSKIGNSENKILQLSICQDNVLKVSNGRVIGNITKNHTQNKNHQPGNEIRYQNLSLAKTERLIKDKIKH